MKKTIAMLLTAVVSASLLARCGSSSQSSSQNTTTAQTGTEANSAADTQSGNSVKETLESSSEAADKAESNASHTIGIGQFAEHGSLDNCRESFLVGLVKFDVQEGKNLTILYENSQADGRTASQIAANFAGREVDLMYGIATPMVQAEYGVAKKSGTPTIFTAVTGPVAAELTNADETPMSKTTGTNDKPPVKQQLKIVRTILPNAKKIGIVYTTNEVNSESATAEYKELAPNYGFEIVNTGVSSLADTSLAADILINKVDRITNLTDNTIVASLPVIPDRAAVKNIPVLGNETEQVKVDYLAVMGLDYIELGRQTGKMATQILKDEKRASGLNYETAKEAAFYGNTKVAENLGITLLEDLTTGAAELFSEITQQI